MKDAMRKGKTAVVSWIPYGRIWNGNPVCLL